VVKNAVTVATGSDAGKERAELSTALDIARGELSRLEATGQAGGPNVVCSASQAAEFRSYDVRTSALDGSIRRVRVSLQDTGSKDTGKELRLLEATAKMLRENIANNKSAQDRLSKMQLWKDLVVQQNGERCERLGEPLGATQPALVRLHTVASVLQKSYKSVTRVLQKCYSTRVSRE
jgi:hypothetical protein